MKKILRFACVATLIFVVGSFAFSLTFAQQEWWDYVTVSVYGNEYDDLAGYSFFSGCQFTVRTPPSGSEITNTVYVLDDETGENYTETLSAGDIFYLRWDNYSPIVNEINEAEEDGYYTFVYEGTARIEINSQFIPEFPAFLVIPMFMAATLLAIFFNKKRSSHSNKTD